MLTFFYLIRTTFWRVAPKKQVLLTCQAMGALSSSSVFKQWEGAHVSWTPLQNPASHGSKKDGFLHTFASSTRPTPHSTLLFLPTLPFAIFHYRKLEKHLEQQLLCFSEKSLFYSLRKINWNQDVWHYFFKPWFNQFNNL
jgi:hypothetical protein